MRHLVQTRRYAIFNYQVLVSMMTLFLLNDLYHINVYFSFFSPNIQMNAAVIGDLFALAEEAGYLPQALLMVVPIMSMLLGRNKLSSAHPVVAALHFALVERYQPGVWSRESLEPSSPERTLALAQLLYGYTALGFQGGPWRKGCRDDIRAEIEELLSEADHKVNCVHVGTYYEVGLLQPSHILPFQERAVYRYVCEEAIQVTTEMHPNRMDIWRSVRLMCADFPDNEGEYVWASRLFLLCHMIMLDSGFGQWSIPPNDLSPILLRSLQMALARRMQDLFAEILLSLDIMGLRSEALQHVSQGEICAFFKDPIPISGGSFERHHLAWSKAVALSMTMPEMGTLPLCPRYCPSCHYRFANKNNVRRCKCLPRV